MLTKYVPIIPAIESEDRSRDEGRGQLYTSYILYLRAKKKKESKIAIVKGCRAYQKTNKLENFDLTKTRASVAKSGLRRIANVYAIIVSLVF